VSEVEKSVFIIGKYGLGGWSRLVFSRSEAGAIREDTGSTI